jgi:integrase
MQTHNWNEAALKYISETNYKASHETDLYHLRWLEPHLNGLELKAIKREVLDKITTSRKAAGVTNATVNRTQEILRAILRKACNEWEWLDRVPFIRMLPEPKKRIRWLTREQANALTAALPPHIAAMAEFSLQTGLRRANVFGLEWSQIDLPRKMAWIHPDQAKARKAIPVPLSTVALKILNNQKDQNQHPTHVFSNDHKKINRINAKTWKRALKQAGIENFRWHDLRHTWASWHVQNGTPLYVLQELGGWASSEMVQQYAHLSSEHLAQWVK